MSINALSVANSILNEAERQGVTVTPMQLQKLIYFANGRHMEINDGKPLASDNFEACQSAVRAWCSIWLLTNRISSSINIVVPSGATNATIVI